MYLLTIHASDWVLPDACIALISTAATDVKQLIASPLDGSIVRCMAPRVALLLTSKVVQSPFAPALPAALATQPTWLMFNTAHLACVACVSVASSML